jgi:predicted nucleotidyltransferase
MNDNDIIEFIDTIKTKYQIKAAMVVGSYLSGKMTKHSDIDIFCVSDNQEQSIRGRVFFKNNEFEYFLSPEWKYYHRMENDLTSVRIYSSGKILFDKNDVLKNIIIQARNKRDNYCPEIDKKKRRDLSFYIESIYTDGIDMLDNNNFENFNIFACIQIEKICGIICQNRKVLPIYPKYFFNELEIIDKQLAVFIKELITMNNNDENKKEKWDQICKYTLQELGNEDIKTYASCDSIQKS